MANGTIAVSQLDILTQSGTGVITVVPPATNTDRTLTLPDEAGTVLTSASSLAAGNLSGSLPAISGAALTGVGKVISYSFHTWGTRTSSTSGAHVVWSVTHTKLSSTSKLVARVSMIGKGWSNGVSGEYISIDGTQYASICYTYDNAWAPANIPIIGTASKVCDAGSRVVSFGVSASGYLATIWNPNSTDDGRNNQKVSTIEILEIET
tara:strand:+ start:1097 stop:1720 length:624 start_codon:yes stop_codon:yes gene_type:complete